MKKELTIAFLMVGLTVGLSSTVTADEEETSVDVEISGVTQLDVRPSSLSYTTVGPGDGGLEPGMDVQESDSGYEHIEVENIGSERIGNIYAQGTMNTEQPFGTDTFTEDTLVHNTGNFVTISTSTASDSSYNLDGLNTVDNMHYLNRVEYFEDNYPTYISVEEGEYEDESGTPTFSVDRVEVGRLRVGGAEYFFAWYEDTDNSNNAIRIGDTPHTSTVLGTVDFSNEGDDYTEYSNPDETTVSGVYQINPQELVTFDTDGDYDGESLIDDGTALGEGDADYPSGGETRSYALYLDRNDDFVVRNRFNVQQQSPDYDGQGAGWELGDRSGDSSQTYILDANSESEALQPGQNFPVDFGVQVPLGVDQDGIEEGTVTVISETYNDSE